jgi:hypothetical protein
MVREHWPGIAFRIGPGRPTGAPPLQSCFSPFSSPVQISNVLNLSHARAVLATVAAPGALIRRWVRRRNLLLSLPFYLRADAVGKLGEGVALPPHMVVGVVPIGCSTFGGATAAL